MSDRTKDGRVIRWKDAEEYAERLASICNTLSKTEDHPPLPHPYDHRQQWIAFAAGLVDEIAEALCLSKHALSPEVLRGLQATTPEAKAWLALMNEKTSS
jgi:hypothetical protein